jgi:hypothetical protein
MKSSVFTVIGLLAFFSMSTLAAQDADSLLVAKALTSDQIAAEVEFLKNSSVGILSVKVESVNDLDTITIVSENGNKEGAEVYFKCKNTILLITRTFVKSKNGSAGEFVFKAEINGDKCEK